MNKNEWNRIDWNAINKITPLILSEDDAVREKAWDYLNARSTHPIVGGIIQTWEHGYQAGLPLESDKYLGLFQRDDGSLWVSTVEYDAENFSPVFWHDYDVVESNSEACYPIAWKKITFPSMNFLWSVCELEESTRLFQ